MKQLKEKSQFMFKKPLTASKHKHKHIFHFGAI